MAQTTGKSESLDDLLAQRQRLAAQAPAAEPPQPADQSLATLGRMFLVSGASLLVAALIIVIGVNIWHQNRPSTSVYSTSDAIVSGTLVTISSPLPGTVTAVFAHVGSKVQSRETIATVKTISGVIMHDKSPIAGTIVNEGATPAEVLGAGTPLAQVIDLDNLFITAYADVRHIGGIRPNESVDITVAIVPGVTFHGRVMQVLPVPVGSITPSPSTNNAGSNATNLSQRIPVQISLDGDRGKPLFPGASASVTIHLH